MPDDFLQCGMKVCVQSSPHVLTVCSGAQCGVVLMKIIMVIQ
jgi:hypothetical protein